MATKLIFFLLSLSAFLSASNGRVAGARKIGFDELKQRINQNHYSNPQACARLMMTERNLSYLGTSVNYAHHFLDLLQGARYTIHLNSHLFEYAVNAHHFLTNLPMVLLFVGKNFSLSRELRKSLVEYYQLNGVPTGGATTQWLNWRIQQGLILAVFIDEFADLKSAEAAKLTKLINRLANTPNSHVLIKVPKLPFEFPNLDVARFLNLGYKTPRRLPDFSYIAPPD